MTSRPLNSRSRRNPTARRVTQRTTHERAALTADRRKCGLAGASDERLVLPERLRVRRAEPARGAQFARRKVVLRLVFVIVGGGGGEDGHREQARKVERVVARPRRLAGRKREQELERRHDRREVVLHEG